MPRRLASAALVLLALLHAPVASARSAEEYAYTYDQLWRAAVRLVAVDLRFPITDRDPEIGYLLFEYRDQGRAFPGSVELVRTQGPDGAERVRVVVQVEAMPSYVERMMLDRLRRKLTDEHGAPPRSAPRPAPAPPPPAPTPPAEDAPEPPEA